MKCPRCRTELQEKVINEVLKYSIHEKKDIQKKNKEYIKLNKPSNTGLFCPKCTFCKTIK
ncbi:MAG: hypothetical protein ACOC56_07080 [Atribacterota bacterium]